MKFWFQVSQKNYIVLWVISCFFTCRILFLPEVGHLTSKIHYEFWRSLLVNKYSNFLPFCQVNISTSVLSFLVWFWINLMTNFRWFWMTWLLIYLKIWSTYFKLVHVVLYVILGWYYEILEWKFIIIYFFNWQNEKKKPCFGPIKQIFVQK